MGIAGAMAMAGRSLFELATPAQTVLAGTKFSGLAKSPFSTTEKPNSYDDVTHYKIKVYLRPESFLSIRKHASYYRLSFWRRVVER
jgi:hypothetical protein